MKNSALLVVLAILGVTGCASRREVLVVGDLTTPGTPRLLSEEQRCSGRPMPPAAERLSTHRVVKSLCDGAVDAAISIATTAAYEEIRSADGRGNDGTRYVVAATTMVLSETLRQWAERERQ